jgi:type I restriction enzyme R subunit
VLILPECVLLSDSNRRCGKLNKVMKAMMPNAVFIGFTGTPLLKKDRQTSLEVFGGYIHTYKFSEAVEDGGDGCGVDRLVASSRQVDHLRGGTRLVKQQHGLGVTLRV